MTNPSNGEQTKEGDDRKIRIRNPSPDSSSTTYSTTDAESASTTEVEDETDDGERTSQRRRRRNRRKPRPRDHKLSSVLAGHEKILKMMNNPDGNTEPEKAELRELLNGLSKTTIKSAIRKEQKKRPKNTSHAQRLKTPNLQKKDADAKSLKDCITLLKENIRSNISGNDSSTVRELFQAASREAEAYNLSPRQFMQLFRSRVSSESPLGKYCRDAIKSETPLRDFIANLQNLFTQGDDYLSALRSYNDFTGRNMSSTEFIATLRQLSAELVTKESGKEFEDKRDFDKAVLEKMRSKFFSTLPALAESILNFERCMGQVPRNTAEFIASLQAHKHNLETNLKASRKVHMIEDDSDPELVQINQVEERKPRPSNQPQSQPQSTSQKGKATTLKLTSSQLTRLQNKCYKCGSESILQNPDHRSAVCVMYQGKALASYVCNRCRIGVHLPMHCLQCDEAKPLLLQKAKELNINIPLDNNVNVVLVDSEEEAEQIYLN